MVCKTSNDGTKHAVFFLLFNLIIISDMQLSKEQIHQVWLECMQMNQCSPHQAMAFLAQVHPLINYPLTPSKQTILMLAASTSSINLLKATLSHKPNINMQDTIGRTALHYASATGNIETFELLVQCGADAKVQSIGGETPLTKACLFAQGDIIQWYLNNCLEAFEIKDNTGRPPLDLLRSSGENLYKEVSSILGELRGEMQE